MVRPYPDISTLVVSFSGGNCTWCFKKSLLKLRMIANETPEEFNFPIKMENKYGRHYPGKRVATKNPVTFFRGGMSAKQILEMKGKPYVSVDDDRDGGCSESCDAFGVAQ